MAAEDIINGLSEQLEPVREIAARLLIEGSKEVPHGVAIWPRPLVAPEYHAVYIFSGVSPHDLQRYEARFALNIPSTYRSVLMQVGGLLAFEFSLFGVPASMAAAPPLLDRSHVQPYDLSLAENEWKHSYAVNQRLFHFGSGPYSENELVGYFLDQDSERVHDYRKNGDLFQRWNVMRDFLVDELERALNEFPKYEEFMWNLQQTARNTAK